MILIENVTRGIVKIKFRSTTRIPIVVLRLAKFVHDNFVILFKQKKILGKF